ncbi:Gfo/Idh/MocA family protein [Paenibacillus thalictri]|uniref:Gfo/Idh/MocA family oxidoreductase n=1 Tax=Paenibacillus thalictri TaxID=2527873 RepID=A0A4Q9DYM0_9BACL|nr:Gfo/Idh/MocA family oxidoreductase [Paenibacillus thalictri]TBL81525.1 Gfo/Idh/MocA family oxidoreductase [Paenibacillus thalictri]
MERLNVALVGLGNIGKTHLMYLRDMPYVHLAAVCDIDRKKAEYFAKETGAAAYFDVNEMFNEIKPDAVIIGVPHYDHPSIAIEAFARGIHVLCEKPISVHVNDAKRMLQAYEEAKRTYPNLEFGLMFQERLYPHYRKIKDILQGGELGKLVRVTWINTTMFRSQAYYNSGGWRATWAGEGGGILVNQCPHTLDMYQWLFGLPEKISAHAHIGKYHDIEVEDEVTAYFEHPEGMIGHLVVSTAESPGTNRLEIVGDNGKLVYEDDKLVMCRNRQPMLTFLKETDLSFGRVENWYTEIPIPSTKTGHHVVAEAFFRRIMQGSGELIAYGYEGLNSVTIANGIMLSSFNKTIVNVPIDADAYETKLNELIASSKFVKTVQTEVKIDMENSFGR